LNELIKDCENFAGLAIEQSRTVLQMIGKVTEGQVFDFELERLR
jgi:hypothetical protein